jgi:hypothetical protein
VSSGDYADPGGGPARRYFVTAYVEGRAQVGRVMRYGFDLFGEAIRLDGDRIAVDGLLTLAEAGRLVDDGHQVLLLEEASKRARAHQEITGFGDWLRDREREQGRR